MVVLAGALAGQGGGGEAEADRRGAQITATRPAPQRFGRGSGRRAGDRRPGRQAVQSCVLRAEQAFLLDEGEWRQECAPSMPVLSKDMPVLSKDMPSRFRPSSATLFHSLHATSQALQPMQMEYR